MAATKSASNEARRIKGKARRYECEKDREQRARGYILVRSSPL